MDMSQMITEDLRLAILQLLEADHDGSHNERVLIVGLDRLGHNVDRDTLRTQLHWLERQCYVSLSDVEIVGMVAAITDAGEDVAKGRTPKVPGIAKASPRKRI